MLTGIQILRRRLPTCSGARFFASAYPALSNVGTATFDRVKKLATESYEKDKATLDAEFKELLNSQKLVLFMEGTPDVPKSELSLNVVKMLTEAQAVPLCSVDVLAHPAILGYALSKSKGTHGPLLFKNGSLVGNHDDLLYKFRSNSLQAAIGTKSTLSTGTFKGELPVSMI
eukprot:GDKH01003597.1.p1 GENE.GDKH01003597.1~~GDKH01003597.1.p1  ORF type:complete len:172 (-),score=22.08 GDKH01003597.1:124-639(-)